MSRSPASSTRSPGRTRRSVWCDCGDRDQVRADFVADAWSVRASIVGGGFASVVGVTATAVRLRDFWAYDERDRAERARRTSGVADGPSPG